MSQRGSTLVFFALVAPVLLALVAFVFGAASLYESQSRLDRAAQAVVMAAIADPAGANADAAAIMSADLGVTASPACPASGSDQYCLTSSGGKAAATLTWTVATPLGALLPVPQVTLTSAAG